MSDVDPFVLAVGQVAINATWLEEELRMLYRQLAPSLPGVDWAAGREFADLISAIDREFDSLPPGPIRNDVTDAIDGCQTVWAARTSVMQGLWSLDDHGRWHRESGRGEGPNGVSGSAASIELVAAILGAMRLRIAGLRNRVMVDRYGDAAVNAAKPQSSQGP